jgi:hypothetical protein
MSNRTGSRALPKDYTLSQRLQHYLGSTGAHCTSAALAKVFRRDMIGVAMTLGRLAKLDSNIKKDGEGKWYFTKGQAGAATPKKAKSAITMDDIYEAGKAKYPKEEVATAREPETFDAEPAGIATGDWRTLEPFEKTIIQALAQRGRINGEITGHKKLRVAYVNDPIKPNFQVALVRVGSNLFVGQAKFNPNDTQPDPLIGQQISFARACQAKPVSI